MSMPSFPKDGANITREQALTMIIASIAMEERALGYIIEAEGDKLRHILDQCSCCATPQEILKVNKSVAKLLEAAAENQRSLRCKLALALDAHGERPPIQPCPPPSPEPPCPEPKPPCPEQKSLMLLRLSGTCLLWRNEGLLPWKCAGGRGGAIRWSRETPSQVELDPGRAYSVSCAFKLAGVPAGSGCIVPEGAGTALPLCFSFRCAGTEPVTLGYTALLLPGSARTVAFRLRSGVPLRVEQAELSIVEV